MKNFITQGPLNLSRNDYEKINHLDKKFDESSKNLILANTNKLKLIKSDVEKRINFSNFIFEKYSRLIKEKNNGIEKKSYIFIVGMPRSGSTLIESIISLNDDVFDLGESEGLPRSFDKWTQNKEKSSLFDLYKKEINANKIANKNITDKNLRTNLIKFYIVIVPRNRQFLHLIFYLDLYFQSLFYYLSQVYMAVKHKI